MSAKIAGIGLVVDSLAVRADQIQLVKRDPAGLTNFLDCLRVEAAQQDAELADDARRNRLPGGDPQKDVPDFSGIGKGHEAPEFKG